MLRPCCIVSSLYNVYLSTNVHTDEAVRRRACGDDRADIFHRESILPPAFGVALMAATGVRA